ncbi:hypothetical protein BGZ82_001581 [Podila clonocystis]|nr:hypothetical protein BGZ82_001581 [Podila clonocystis]
MSDYTKELHDPAVESHLDDAHLEDNAASSGILLEKADYETGHSPEVTSLDSSAILAEKEDDDEDDDHVLVANASKPQATKAHSEKTTLPTPTTTTSTSTSTALATTEDLDQTMPWKLLYPIASRETILSLLKATAINFMLPFINGVFLGFGEICAHELAFRWGWTNSAHVVNPAGRPRVANVGIRAGGGVSASGSRSGIGGLGSYEDEINNKTTSTTTYSY